MKINYNIDHRLFSLSLFEEKMTNTQRFATMVTLSQIVHFSKNNGSCVFYVGQMSNDFKIRKSFFSDAIKLLIEYKMIKLIKPYDRKTQSAAVYQWDIGYISEMKKLYPAGHKAVYQPDPVNNSKELLNGNDSLLNHFPNGKQEMYEDTFVFPETN